MAGSKDTAWIDYKTSQQSQALGTGYCNDLFHLGHCVCTDPLCSRLEVKGVQTHAFRFFSSVSVL